MTLYEKIQFLCESTDITRKELARQTGISYATLNSMFSRQSTHISLETIRAIAKHFNVSLDYLLANEIDHSAQDSDLENEKIAEATKLFRELCPEFQGYALQQLEKLLVLQKQIQNDA